MRLDWLEVSDYRNLRNFRIDFDESQPTTVLLGRNGSGKSNLIEVIVEIFRELDSGKATPFAYSMKYVCYDHQIEIQCNPSKSSRLVTITIDGNNVSMTEFIKGKVFYLPQYIFAYYSGWNSRLERQFEEKTRQYYDQILRNSDNEMPFRRFFYCRKDYSQLVLLAFFLADNQPAKNLLRDYLDIESFESALFVLRTPSWGEGAKKRKANIDEVDSHFWNARGAFRPFLARLWDSALAPIRNNEVIERDIRQRGEPTERLYLFIKDEAQLESLRAPYETPKLFFANLEALFLCDLIDEVRINVKKKDGNRVTFSQLSEGEQQLLTVLGLLMFTQGDESLYLLDEPDTHLNPLWTYDFLKLMQETIHAASGQLMIATHNPLMIGTLHKNQVRVLRQTEEATIAEEPEYDPIGVGVEGLLKSELYGLPSTLAPEVLQDIYTENELLTLPNRTIEQETRLTSATERLKQLGITRSHPNPLFDLFSKALANQPRFQKPVLTKEEIEAQEKLANEILDRILRKSE